MQTAIDRVIRSFSCFVAPRERDPDRDRVAEQPADFAIKLLGQYQNTLAQRALGAD